MHGLEGLRAHYSVICLNDDKDIIKSDELDAYTLAEMVAGASPYLVLIPKSPATILMSASKQYECLCLLKDVKKLRKAPSEYKVDQSGLYASNTGSII